MMQRGQIIKEVREPVSKRTVELSLNCRKITATCEETRTTIPAYPGALEPDPVEIFEEAPVLNEVEVLRTICKYKIDALISLYREERLNDSEYLKKQSFSFFTMRIQDEREYLYADTNIANIERILMVHSLPKKRINTCLLPLVLSKNVVGNIFHEYVHTLERDLCKAEPDTVVGNSVFDTVRRLCLHENPELQTVGYTVFSDEGKMARMTPLIEDNIIVGFVDSLLYPYNIKSCGYLGYGMSYFPYPRSTNLSVQGECEQVTLDDYIEVTELDLNLLSLNPLMTGIAVSGGEGVFITGGVPTCRISLDFLWKGTIEEMISETTFIKAETWLPSLGGICVKNEILFRSAQTAPPALWTPKTKKI